MKSGLPYSRGFADRPRERQEERWTADGDIYDARGAFAMSSAMTHFRQY